MPALSATPPTAATALRAPSGQAPPPPPGTPLPPSELPGATLGKSREGVRLRVAHWMEEKFGRAAMPIAALAGGAIGGGAGFLALGPVGGLIGGVAGAFAGAALFMSG